MMYRHIREIIRPINLGCTDPLLAMTDDGDYAVIKLKGNGQGIQVLFNELFASQMASFLGVPTPDFFVGIIDAKTESTQDLSVIDFGLCFCSKYISPQAFTPTKSTLKYVDNGESILNIVLFDLLICNEDRNNGNLIVSTKPTIHLYAIDYSDILGPADTWDDMSLNDICTDHIAEDRQVIINNRSTYNYWLVGGFFDINLLDNIIETNYSKVTKEVIEQFVSIVPSEWWKPDGIILDALTNLLIERKNHLHDSVRCLNR